MLFVYSHCLLLLLIWLVPFFLNLSICSFMSFQVPCLTFFWFLLFLLYLQISLFSLSLCTASLLLILWYVCPSSGFNLFLPSCSWFVSSSFSGSFLWLSFLLMHFLLLWGVSLLCWCFKCIQGKSWCVVLYLFCICC